MGRVWGVALLALALAGGTAERAEANPATVTITGTADGSVNGTPFTSAPFTAVASFYWSADVLSSFDPVASYPASLSFTIGGAGPYTSVPGTEIFAVLYQPASFGGNYAIEIQTASSNVLEAFGATSWDSTTQTVQLASLSFASSAPPFSVPLTGGGSLQINTFDSLGSTASILAPEPGSMSLFGLGLATTALLRRRRRAV